MSRENASLNLHASAVAFGERGVLILGASGAGKSGLALRLIAAGARLVADDRVLLDARDGALIASAPAALRGMIEARGIGLLRADALDAAALVLAVDLDRSDAARMPHPHTIAYLGLEIELMLADGVPNLAVALVQLFRFGRT